MWLTLGAIKERIKKKSKIQKMIIKIKFKIEDIWKRCNTTTTSHLLTKPPQKVNASHLLYKNKIIIILFLTIFFFLFLFTFVNLILFHIIMFVLIMIIISSNSIFMINIIARTHAPPSSKTWNDPTSFLFFLSWSIVKTHSAEKKEELYQTINKWQLTT